MTVPEPTARLVFRTWRDDDRPLALALFGDPRVMALVGGPLGEELAGLRLAVEITTQREHGFQYWPMFLADGTHVGCCGLKPRVDQIYELGFYLHVAHWGRGFAIEAARGVIAYAFDRPDDALPVAASALFAGHHPDNHGSRAVLDKLGFRYTHHELYPPTGLEHPGYELSTTRERIARLSGPGAGG